jgi:hypothetical protein
MILAFVMMSCSDDSTNPDDDTVIRPDTKLMIIATIDGGESDTTEVEKNWKNDSYSPKGFLISGNYYNKLKYITLTIDNQDTLNPDFSFSVAVPVKKLMNKTYQADKSGAYLRNYNLSEFPYFVESGPFTISNMKKIEEDSTIAYYCDGEFDLHCKSPKATRTLMSVKASFTGLPIVFNEDE